jgi:flagellar biosynthetic protein FliQ
MPGLLRPASRSLLRKQLQSNDIGTNGAKARLWHQPCFTRSRQLYVIPEARPTVTHQLVIDLTRDAIVTALMIAAPMLLIALGVGLVISIIQSVTQIQEQTLTFVPKLVLVGGAFIVGMPWLMQILIKFTTQIIRGIPAMVA